jgi:hypothetical protein
MGYLKQFFGFLAVWPVQFLFLLSAFVSVLPLCAQETDQVRGGRAVSDWYRSFEAGGGFQAATVMDGGGEFSLNRFALSGSVGYRGGWLDSVGLSVGYQNRDYDFKGGNLLLPSTPWDHVHFAGLSLPMRKRLGDDWMVMAVPTIRTITEDFEGFEQDLTGGGIFGTSYQFSPRLKIGPGFGILSQIEDQTSVFPVVLIDWSITDKWALQTGRGFGASQGPGLSLSYDVSDSWSLTLSGRFDRYRFRMDQKGALPGGIGEDRNASFYLAAGYVLNPLVQLDFFTGLTFAGELSVDDVTGNEIMERNYDATPLVGANVRLRF